MATISNIPISHPAYRAPSTISKPILSATIQEVVDELVSQTQPARLQAFLARPASVLPNTEDDDNKVAEIHLTDDAASVFSASSSTTAAVDANEVCSMAPTPVAAARIVSIAAPASQKSQGSSVKSNSSSMRQRMSAGWKQYRKDVRATFKALNSYHAF